jgi:hypothetical protein
MNRLRMDIEETIKCLQTELVNEADMMTAILIEQVNLRYGDLERANERAISRIRRASRTRLSNYIAKISLESDVNTNELINRLR